MERKTRPFADRKGTLNTGKAPRADAATNSARCVEGRAEKEVHKTNQNYTRCLKGFGRGEGVKRIPNVCTQ